MWRAQQHGSQPAEAAEVVDPELTPLETLIVVLVEELFQIFLVVVAAWLYIKYKPDPFMAFEGDDKEDSLDGKFKHSLFVCCQMPCVTLFTCFCEGIRWADTMRLIGVLSFSGAIMTWLIINCVCILLAIGGFGNAILSTCALAVVLTYYRQQLREKFRMDSNYGIAVVDCLSYAFCGPCTIVQDARQVEEAKILGHSAVKGDLGLTFSRPEA